MRGFLASYRAQLEQAIAQTKDDAQKQPWRDEIALIDAGKALYPDVKVTRSGTESIAGHAFDVHLATHAATAGDVWIFDKPSGVLVAGDLVTLPVPFFDTACPDGWKRALDALAEVPFRGLVPGHGKPMQRERFAIWRKAFANLVSCAATPRDKGACADGWLADAGPLLAGADARWVKTLAEYYVEEALRAPKAKRELLCRP